MTDPQSTLGVNRVETTPPGSTSHSGGMTGGTNAASDGAAARATGRRRSDRIISASAQMQEVVDQASAIARSDQTIVLSGPSGSGRKHVARAIHEWSARAGSALIELQIAGTTDAIQQRELLGDGTAGQLGALARAQNGSLLIENADQLSTSLVARIAESAQNVRILATCSDESAPAIADIAQRLQAHPIRISPLSARTEDILPLAAPFLGGVCRRGIARSDRLQRRRHDAWLIEESWNGNVRELRERIRQAIRLAGQGAISAEALMLSTEGDEVPSFKDAKRSFETRYVEGLLRRCSGNISRAARMAKKDRKDFYDVIRRTGVNPAQFRG